MCFTNEADWYAEVSSSNGAMATTQVMCHECLKEIPAGTYARYVWQQEHECCQWCENEECECPNRMGEYHECQCSDPDYGECFECWICRRCCMALQAIHDVEIEEGCREHESQPMYGNLWESVADDRVYGGGKYLARIQRDYPGLELPI